MKTNTYLALFICFLVQLTAEAQYSLYGEVRPRTELYGGTNSRLINSGESVGVATQQRTRLYFSYMDTTTNLKIVFSPQLVHFWGQMPQAYDLLGDNAPTGPEANFSVFEAYAEYKATDWYTLKVGRQAISYWDQRWFGALGWAASGRAHDALVNKLSFNDVKIDVGVALNRVRHFQGVDSTAFTQIRGGYNSMQYIWATIPIGNLKVQTMVTNVINTESLTSTSVDYDNTTTFGIFPSYQFGKVAINASAYWQTGQNDRSAYLYAFDFTYKGLGFPITLGADIVSSDDPTTSDNEAWLQPFGTNHKFYGLMDFFYVGPGESVGLNDFYIKSVLKTGEKSKIIGSVHNFYTNQDRENLEGELESGSYGTEIDLIFDYAVSKGFNFKLGYSTIFATDLLEAYKGGDSDEYNQWAWMQLTFKPKFL
ncbi:MAG: hypothetical protein AAGI25_10510 [Bacteroidota bacterium]